MHNRTFYGNLLPASLGGVGYGLGGLKEDLISVFVSNYGPATGFAQIRRPEITYFAGKYAVVPTKSAIDAVIGYFTPATGYFASNETFYKESRLFAEIGAFGWAGDRASFKSAIDAAQTAAKNKGAALIDSAGAGVFWSILAGVLATDVIGPTYKQVFGVDPSRGEIDAILAKGYFAKAAVLAYLNSQYDAMQAEKKKIADAVALAKAEQAKVGKSLANAQKYASDTAAIVSAPLVALAGFRGLGILQADAGTTWAPGVTATYTGTTRTTSTTAAQTASSTPVSTDTLPTATPEQALAVANAAVSYILSLVDKAATAVGEATAAATSVIAAAAANKAAGYAKEAATHESIAAQAKGRATTAVNELNAARTQINKNKAEAAAIAQKAADDAAAAAAEEARKQQAFEDERERQAKADAEAAKIQARTDFLASKKTLYATYDADALRLEYTRLKAAADADPDVLKILVDEGKARGVDIREAESKLPLIIGGVVLAGAALWFATRNK